MAPTGIGKNVNVSVVTYTYNDHRLAHGLLDSVCGWTVRPREIVVVDDGSDTPFSYGADAHGIPVHVLRNATNLGPAGAKHAGLSAARARFLLSMDCDVRIDADWLAQCLPEAGQKDVGMVSTRVVYDAGDSHSPMSAYLRMTYSFLPDPGPVPMIPGPVFLMRREPYTALGGLAGCGKRLGEDEYLCGLLTHNGYALRIHGGPQARQMRRLSPATMVRRGFTWQQNTFFDELANGAPLHDVANVFIYSVGTRPALSGPATCLSYYDLLYCAYGLLRLYRHAGAPARAAGRIHAHLKDHKHLHAAMDRDLHELGCCLDQVSATDTDDLPMLRTVFPHRLCAFLDACQADGALPDAWDEDYSMYATPGA